MEKVSYHTHTTISDGKLSPRELIECAIEKGFKVLAITDHYTRPEGIDFSGWSTDFYTEEDYVELRKLQKEYEGRIEVLVGAEFEWYLGKQEWTTKEVKRREYDVKIMAIHQILVGDRYYPVNHHDWVVDEIVAALGGDVQKMVEIYYETLKDAARSGLFDIVAHFDLIKTFNKGSRYFCEEDSWYKEEVVEALKVIKEFGLKMEVNLQGLRKACEEQWPSKWIINKARGMGIELVVGTDAHNEEALDYDVDEVEKLLN